MNDIKYKSFPYVIQDFLYVNVWFFLITWLYFATNFEK